MDTGENDIILELDGLKVGFGDRMVIDGLDLAVRRGEVLGVIGPSGSGKSVTLRAIIGLLPKRGGTVRIDGADMDDLPRNARRAIERRWGVLFQQGALFSSLSVLENVEFPMREHLDLPPALRREIARLKIALVGLGPESHDLRPSELSGGMIKRAALARALALDPAIVFLDEPTSGLDPISAGDFDALIKTLQKTLAFTVFMVTHDLASLNTVCDRIAALADGKIVSIGPMPTLLQSDHPWVRAYFHGVRSEMLQPHSS